MTTITENIDRPAIGIALMLTGLAGFAVMDAIIKWRYYQHLRFFALLKIPIACPVFAIARFRSRVQG